MEAGILSELFQPVAKIRKGIIHVLVVLSINQHKKKAPLKRCVKRTDLVIREQRKK